MRVLERRRIGEVGIGQAGEFVAPEAPEITEVDRFLQTHERVKKVLMRDCVGVQGLMKQVQIQDKAALEDHLELFRMDGYAYKLTEETVCSTESVGKLTKIFEEMRKK